MAELSASESQYTLEQLLRSSVDLTAGLFSIRVTGAGGGSGQTVSVGAGAVDSTTTRVVHEDLIRDPWLNSLNLNVAGGSTSITYFTGVVARNPSGSTENIDSVVYNDGTNSRTLTFTYNATDQITNVATT